MSMLARNPERSSPSTRTRPSRPARSEIARQRRDLEHELVLEVVGLGHDAAEPGLGHQVVRAVHAEQVSGEELVHLGHVVAGPPHQRLGVVGQRGAVAVADGQVLGPHLGAVRRHPGEAVARHL